MKSTLLFVILTMTSLCWGGEGVILCDGKLIHPYLIEEFTGYLSDKGYPLTISVDLEAACDTNEYPDFEVKTDARGRITADRDGGFFAYDVIGGPAPGFYVLKTWKNTGGSGVFRTILMVREYKDNGHFNGKPYSRRLLTVVAVQTLEHNQDPDIRFGTDLVNIRFKDGTHLVWGVPK